MIKSTTFLYRQLIIQKNKIANTKRGRILKTYRVLACWISASSALSESLKDFLITPILYSHSTTKQNKSLFHSVICWFDQPKKKNCRLFDRTDEEEGERGAPGGCIETQFTQKQQFALHSTLLPAYTEEKKNLNNLSKNYKVSSVMAFIEHHCYA